MKLIRVITMYDKASEVLINETNTSFIDKNKLIEIFSPPINDPAMYNPYHRNSAMIHKKKKMPKKIYPTA